MNIVAVTHKGSCKKYWFEVPDELVDRVKCGVKVVCDTARGKIKAITVSEVKESDDFRPTRKIVKVIDKKRVKTDSILIPWSFKKTTPRKDKLIARINEYYDNGDFNTNIEVDSDGVLKDGYTAWLVAKMLGVKYLNVKV